MNSKEFIQAIENKDVLVYKNGDQIMKKIYSQKTGKGYCFHDFEIGLFIIFDDVKKNGKTEIGLYLKDAMCGIMDPDSWVIA
jgi:hypothetical protein